MSKEIIKIKNFEIKLGSLYQVNPKFDASAPDGFQEYRTTKLLTSTGINLEAIPFDESRNVWDTGLYTTSPCYQGMNKSEVKNIVDTLTEKVVKPLEEEWGEGVLDHKKENTFWDSYGIELYRSKVFNTEKPLQTLNLFHSLIQGLLAPKGKMESSPDFRLAQFVVEDKEKVISLEQEKDLLNTETIGKFYALLNGDVEQLRNVLNYIGIKIPVGSTVDKAVVSNIFNRSMDSAKDEFYAKKSFVEAYDKSLKPAGYNELKTFRNLEELFLKGEVEKDRENFVLRGEELGVSLKDAARKVSSTPKLQAMVESIIDPEPKKAKAKSKTKPKK